MEKNSAVCRKDGKKKTLRKEGGLRTSRTVFATSQVAKEGGGRLGSDVQRKGRTEEGVFQEVFLLPGEKTIL